MNFFWITRWGSVSK